MPSHSNNYGLLDRLFEKVLPDGIGGFIPIHKGHIAVHQDQFVVTIGLTILFNVLFDEIHGLYTIVSTVANTVRIYLTRILSIDLKRLNIEELIIDNQYLLCEALGHDVSRCLL